MGGGGYSRLSLLNMAHTVRSKPRSGRFAGLETLNFWQPPNS